MYPVIRNTKTMNINPIEEEQEDDIPWPQYLFENEDKFGIWHVGSEEQTMHLYKTSDDTFRTIQQGIWGPILHSPVYTIVREDLITFLAPYFVEQVDVHPVTIYDRPSESNRSGYYKVSSKETYNCIDIINADPSVKRVWVEVGSLAVTRELKEALEQSNIPGVRISPFLGYGC